MCVAVGSYLDANSNPAGTLAELWNGSSWSLLPTPKLSAATLDGVSCPTVSACVAVGYHGTNAAQLIEAWNGTTWSVQKGAAAGTAGTLSGNQDNAFDNLAVAQLGINGTDLHCLNIIENSGGLTAGELAAQSGLTNGAITGVLDRLERAGLARRVSNSADRRRVTVEVTPAFSKQAERIWGPMAADWQATLGQGFTIDELERIRDFLRATAEIGRRQLDRLRETAADTGRAAGGTDRQ